MRNSLIHALSFAASTLAAPRLLPAFPGSVVSWGEERLDVFVNGPYDDVYHKYHANAKAGWNTGFEFMNMTLGKNSFPVGVSWGKDRLDVFGNAYGLIVHKFWDGSQWQPAEEPEELAIDADGQIAVTSWGEGRFDIIARNDSDGGYWHKYYDGSAWQPKELDMEPLGKDGFGEEWFAHDPTAVSWGKDRLDIFGVLTNGTILHKFWDGSSWQPSATAWQQFGDGFAANKFPQRIPQNLLATSWGKNRYDLWAIKPIVPELPYGNLMHRYWDGHKLSDWENMGGLFLTIPTVSHWSKNRADIFSGYQFLFDKTATNRYKYWDGSQWNPAINETAGLDGEWMNHGPLEGKDGLGTSVASGSWANNNLHAFAIDTKGKLRWQFWEGSQWLPKVDDYYDLGELPTYNGAAKLQASRRQKAQKKAQAKNEKARVKNGLVVQDNAEHLAL